MKRWSRLVGVVAMSALLTSYAEASSQGAPQEIRCQGDACIPEHSGLLLLYALDANGAPVQGAAVVATHSVDATCGQRPARQLLTDWAGMVAMTVRGSDTCELRVSAMGFRDVIVGNVAVAAGKFLVVSVRLDVDPDRLMDVLTLPPAG